MPRRMPSRRGLPDQEAEEQRPAKVPRTDGSESKDLDSHLRDLFKLPGVTSIILQDRVRIKVQQLLAGAELENTTIGSLRRNLEDELGLAPDSLLSTKRIRKWIHQVLEQEVLKKSQRSSKCERICRMLARIERYPANCRKMLIEALPCALADPEGGSGGGEPHPHQVRILETVEMVLQDDLEHAKVQIEAIEQRIQAEKVKVEECQEACSVVASAADEVIADCERKEKSAVVAEDACADAKGDLINAQKKHDEAIEGRPKLLSNRENCKAFLESYQRLQEEGIHAVGQEAAKEKKLDEVKHGLEALGTQESLVIAGLLALKKSPSVRSRFEDGAAQEILKVFKERAEKIEEELATNSLLSEDSLVREAEVLYDAMIQNAANKLLVAVESREARDKKGAELEAAKKTVAAQAKILKSCEAEHRELDAKVVDMNEVLAMVEQLTKCTDIVTSPEKPSKGDDDDNEAEAYRIYTGSFSHPDMGKDAIPIRVVLYTPTQGKWTAYDQTDQITVVCEGDSIRLMDSSTELEGQDVGSGVIKGVVIQSGSRGGEFELRVEAPVPEDSQEDVSPSNLENLFESVFDSNAEVEKDASTESQHAAEEPTLRESATDVCCAMEVDRETTLASQHAAEEPALAEFEAVAIPQEASTPLVEPTTQDVEVAIPKVDASAPKIEAASKVEATQAPSNKETEIEVVRASGGA